MVSKCKAWCTCKFTKHDYPIIHYSYLFPFNFSVKFCPCVCFLFPRIFILLAINQQRSLFQVTMSITTSSRLFPLASMATSASIQLLTSTRSHSWWVVNTLFRAFRKFTHIFAEFTQLLHDFNLFVQKLGGVFYKWVWGHFIGDAYSMSIHILNESNCRRSDWRRVSIRTEPSSSSTNSWPTSSRFARFPSEFIWKLAITSKGKIIYWEKRASKPATNSGRTNILTSTQSDIWVMLVCSFTRSAATLRSTMH